MLDKLTLFISHLGHWGYLVIFLIVVLECQAFLGLAMPGESLVLIGGFLAKNGLLDLGDLIVVVAVAATLGDSISYELGRHLGSEWLLKHGRRFGFRQERLTRVKNFLDRHGGKAVFTSHFMHVMRALMPFIAGSCRMRYRWFLIFNAAGCVVWAATFGLIGYLVGAGWELVAKRIGLASAIVGGTLILVIALAWLWHWLERHEAEIRQRGRTIMNLPIVARLGRRFSRPLTFLRNRLSPRGYLGLHLTVGVLLIIGATWLFGGIAEDVMTGDPLTVIDRTISDWLHAHQTPGLTAAMQITTHFASLRWVVGITAIIAGVLLLKKSWYRLLALVIVIPGGMALVPLLKAAFHRQRPDFADALLIFKGYSFPSGHTMAATLLYGLLAYFAAQSSTAWHRRVRASFAAFIIILLIGFSRLYLGAHYLSDVLAAGAAGLAWMAFSLTAVDTLRRSRNRNESPEPQPEPAGNPQLKMEYLERNERQSS